MLTELRDIDELPRQKASQVKNKWGDVVRLVHQSGSVAITNHANIEMVLVDAEAYRELTRMAQAMKERNRATLEQLNERFSERLAVLQQPDAHDRLDSLLATRSRSPRGKSKDAAPKAGPAY
jgi:PHD/YefM family antitoxin component YafN of YafNO toxin-antitoxin module